MKTSAEIFVHVLLFDCPQCTRPIPLAITSKKRNVEDINAHLLTVRCPCDWSEKLMGSSARCHWVDSWGPRNRTFEIMTVGREAAPVLASPHVQEEAEDLHSDGLVANSR